MCPFVVAINLSSYVATRSIELIEKSAAGIKLTVNNCICSSSGSFFYCFTYEQDDHKAFRRQLEDKRPIVEANLLSGRQYVASEPPVSDNSDTEGTCVGCCCC